MRKLLVPMFAKCVDSEKELKPAFITPTAQANSMAEASKLKLAWEAACLLTEKILKREPETDLDSLHELDTLLALAIQEDLEDRFTTVYSWNGFLSVMVGCDSLLGRVNRKFLVAKTSMFRIARVRSRTAAASALRLRGGVWRKRWRLSWATPASKRRPSRLSWSSSASVRSWRTLGRSAVRSRLRLRVTMYTSATGVK